MGFLKIKRGWGFLTFLFIVSYPNAVFADIIHVPGGEPTIQAAIDVANEGDTVLVADGIYTGSGNKNIDFGGKALTVKSDNGPNNCVIDCEGAGRGFYFHNGEENNSVLSGFTITNGYESPAGGGIYCSNSSSPTIADCIIVGNTARHGGGIFCSSSSPKITNCAIRGNGDIIHTINGGGMVCDGISKPDISDCIIEGNVSGVNIGGVFFLNSCNATITNCFIRANKGKYGGGIGLSSSSTMITNCVINGNSSETQGGGIFCSSSSPTITNCTIRGNIANINGGGFHSVSPSSSPTITNCILWEDTPNEINVSSGILTVTYSDVQAGYEGQGNIDSAPLFVNAENNDYHLKANSPCIDSGIAESAPNRDIEGTLRPQGAGYDMGAYEHVVVAAPVWVPLYRLYNNSIQDHYYTTIPEHRDRAVTDSGYTYEKIEGFISDRSFDDPDCIPLYHLYSASLNCHFYTTSESEKAQKLSEGFSDEGTVGFIYQEPFEGGISLYRLYNAGNTDYFCTVSEFEHDYAINNWGFGEETVLGYVSPDGLMNPKSRLNFNAIVGNGVNTGNGNLNLYERTDFSIPGINIPLIFTRTYNSLNQGVDGPLGHGWTHSFDAVLKDDGTYVCVRWPDGHGDYYERDGNMTPENPARAINQGCYDTIYQEGDGSYWITKKDQTQYVFKRPEGSEINAPAQFRTIIEKNGNSISLWYEDGNLVWIQDTSLRRINFTYYTAVEGHSGHIKEISDPLGRIIRFEYDVNDNLTGFIDARGNRTTYEYNADHQLTRGIFPEENELNNTYENFKLVSQEKGILSNPLSVVYETNRTVITDLNGKVSHHNLVEDQLISIEDPLGNIASFTFGDSENPTKPTLIQDKNGNTTTYTYKNGADDIGKKVLQRGNILRVENALTQETAFDYDDKNNLTKKTDPLNHITNYEYDVNQRNLIRLTYPEGGIQNISYTANGQVEIITYPNGNTTTYTYDSHGNITKVTDHLGNHIDLSYDNVGRLLTRMDPLGRTTTYSYDENDNLLQVIDAYNKATGYTYDTNDNRTKITDAREKETTYTYNDRDLLATETDPVGKVYQYGYDDKGNLTLIRDPDNNETTYVYDDNDRLTEIIYNTISKVSFTEYDNNGNLLRMTDDNGETAFVYDALNRITSCNDSSGKTVSYGYDAAGNRTQITYPGTGKVVNYEYDADNRLIKVTDWLNGETTSSYDSAGILQSLIHPNGTKTTYSYDAANRLTGLSNEKADDTSIADYTYTLDAFGNHTRVIKNEPLTPTFPTVDISYTYDDANKIASAGGITYTHDSRGNLTGTSSGNVYNYDYADRLTAVTIGGESIQYLYDGQGNRIARTAGGVQTRYILDLNGPMSQVLAETDSGGNVMSYYIYGHGLISKITASNQRSCYHYDSRGSTIAITDSGENITEKYVYDEFGEVLASEETNANPFRYVGKYGVMDEKNGLLFMRARYYDVATGRFLSKDPLRGDLLEPGSLNRYAYVMGNPMMGIDPRGLEGFDTAGSTVMVVEGMKYGDRLYKFTNWAEAAEEFIRSASSVADLMALYNWQNPWVAWPCKAFATSTIIGFVIGDTVFDGNKPTNLRKKFRIIGRAIRKVWDESTWGDIYITTPEMILD